MRIATLRYIAFISENPEKITDFYNRFLGTKELGRSPHGDISITDGFYNLTFFKKRPSLREPIMEVGLHHVGVQVDSIENVKARYMKFNPRGVIAEEAGDLCQGEIRIFDPECHPVSLSEKSFGVSAKDEKQFPRVRHIAYNALDPERMLQFYNQVLGLREVPTSYVRRPARTWKPLRRRRLYQSCHSSVLQPSGRSRGEVRDKSYRFFSRQYASNHG